MASALLCMGNVRSRGGEFDEALSLYSERVTSTLKIIGMVYARREDLPSAMRCFEEALSLLSSPATSPTSPPTPTTSSNGVGVAFILTRMGGVYYRRGR